MPLVVDAEAERLIVQGFRFANRGGGDDATWRIWQDNQLDAESQIAHEIALTKGVAYTLVAPPLPAASSPLITIEDPTETILETAPGNRRIRLAALKVFTDDDGLRPGVPVPPRRDLPLAEPRSADRPDVHVARVGDVGAVPRGGRGLADHNPIGVVPVIPLLNKPRRDGTGRSEIEPVMGNQSAINKLRFDALVASEFVAFPQRWVTNIDIPVDRGHRPADRAVQARRRQPVGAPPADAGRGRRVRRQGPGAGVRPVPGRRPRPYIDDDHVRGRADVLDQPDAVPLPARDEPSSVPPSGESLKSSEAPLVKKIGAQAVHFGEGWEETMRVALLAAGQSSKARTDGETIWADPETRNEAARTDSILKQYRPRACCPTSSRSRSSATASSRSSGSGSRAGGRDHHVVRDHRDDPDAPTWVLCDGTQNSPGPDLRDKFVVGATQDSGGRREDEHRGLAQGSATQTGASIANHAALTHTNGAVGDHTGLTHDGAVASHPDLTHAALSHPAITVTHPDHSVASASHTHASGADVSVPSGSFASTGGCRRRPGRSRRTPRLDRLRVVRIARGDLGRRRLVRLPRRDLRARGRRVEHRRVIASLANASVPAYATQSGVTITGTSRGRSSRWRPRASLLELGLGGNVSSLRSRQPTPRAEPLARRGHGLRPVGLVASSLGSEPFGTIASAANASGPSGSHRQRRERLRALPAPWPRLGRNASGPSGTIASTTGVAPVAHGRPPAATLTHADHSHRVAVAPGDRDALVPDARFTPPAGHGTAGTLTHAFTQPDAHAIG
jgi:hypothetical protein